MSLYFVLALMTMAAIFAVLWPLRGQKFRTGGADVAVYRDQLEELERERNAGLIGEAELGAARVEVARRLIAAADAAARPGEAKGSPRRPRIAAGATLLLLPVGAAVLYGLFGSPTLPGAPLAARLQQTPVADRSIESLVAQVEAHLERNPEDGRGWEVIAPVYLQTGRFQDAVKARSNALRLNGANAAREADYGEALVAASNGIVTSDARAAFERALAHERGHVKARYFLGLAAEQDGKTAEASAIWREMLDNARGDPAWTDFIRRSLARVDPSAAPPGPSAEDMAAAANLTAEQRSELIRGMVARLAARLRQDGADLDAWQRLMRAYMVLGEPEKAKAAAADARTALGSDADKLRRLDEFVGTLGLNG